MNNIESSIKIINSIMSVKSRPSILMSKSDASNISFLSSLQLNYYKAFMFDIKSNLIINFALDLCYTFIDDEEEIKKIRQAYCIDNMLFKSQNIIDFLIKYIEKLNYNTLVVISNLEYLPSSFDYEELEYLLSNCPNNLRILLISNKFLDINYHKLITNAPNLINEETYECDITDNDISAKYDKDDWITLAYLSNIYNLDSVFLEQNYPRIIEMIKELFINSNKGVLFIGKAISISEKFKSIIFDKYGTNEKIAEEINSNYFNYLLNQKILIYDRLLDFSIKSERQEWINIAVQEAIKSGYGLCELNTYTKLHYFKSGIPNVGEEYLKFLQIYLLNNLYCFDSVIRETNTVLNGSKLPDDLFYNFLELNLDAQYNKGNIPESIEKNEFFISTYIKKNGIDKIESIINLVIQYLKFHYKENRLISKELFSVLFDELLKEQYKDKYWYYNTLSYFVSVNLTNYNYSKCNELIKKIDENTNFRIITESIIYSSILDKDNSKAEEYSNLVLNNLKYADSDSIVDAYIIKGIDCYENKNNKNIGLEYFDKAIQVQNASTDRFLIALIFRLFFFKTQYKSSDILNIAELYYKKYQSNLYYAFLSKSLMAYLYFIDQEEKKSIDLINNLLKNTEYNKSLFYYMDEAILINHNIKYGEDGPEIKAFIAKCKNVGFFKLFKIFLTEFHYLAEYINDPRNAKNVGVVIERDTFSKVELKIKIFGNIGVFVNNEEIKWKTIKTYQLFLVYMIRGNNGISRKELINIFWDGYIYSSALNNLKTTNNMLRNALKEKNVDFKLIYSNSKYTLKISNYVSDYYSFQKTFEELKKETDLGKKLMLMVKVLSIYSSGFCKIFNDIPFFLNIDNYFKREIGNEVLNLALKFAIKGETITVKKCLSALDNLNIKYDNYPILLKMKD